MRTILLLALSAGALLGQASFPSALPTNNDLLTAVDRFQTTLTVGIDSDDTSFTVASGAGAPAGATLLTIDDEIIKATISGNTVTVLSRGVAGTSATSHLSGRAVRAQVSSPFHNRMRDEVIAIATSLGPNLSNVGMEIQAAQYDFAAQQPGGSLSIGSNSVTLSPCPAGLNGSDADHRVYISGGVGTAESVLITGGTCTSGAASGTVIFTAVNAHSGSWTVSSATAGIQEAVIAAMAESRKVVRVGGGTKNIRGTITIGASNVTLQGSGIGATVLMADNAVSPVVQVGSPAVMSERVYLKEFTVTRTGTAPAGSIGVLWKWAHYVGTQRIRVTSHAIGLQFDYRDSSSVSLGATMEDSYVDTCSETYVYVAHFVGLKFIGGDFGLNGSLSGDNPPNVIVIANNSDTIQFVGFDIIPRQSSTRLLDFRNYTGVGVIRFETCNIEQVQSLIRSDSSTASIYELQMVNVRFAPSGSLPLFSLNAATTLFGFKIVASAINGNFNLPKGIWTTITGNHFGPGDYTLDGSSGSTSSLAFTGNAISGNITLSGTWASLIVSGNTFYSTTLVNSATATSMQIGPNTTNQPAPIVNAWSHTTMSGYFVPQVINRAYVPTLADSFFPNGTLMWCSDCAADGTSCSAGTGAFASKRNGSFYCF